MSDFAGAVRRTPPAPAAKCEREGLTPIPDHGVLLIDCSVHGPIGVITAGDDEYHRAERAFSKHLGTRRCQDCTDDPDGPCPMCAVALFGAAEARAYFKILDEREQLRSDLRVAQTGEKFGKVAVAERDQARAALESTQNALREMEQKRDAWKVAAGVDYRDLDVTPDEARAANAARQARIDAALALADKPLDWLGIVDEFAAAIRAALQGDQPTEPRHDLILTSGLSGSTGACSCGGWRGGGRHELPSRIAHRWDAEHLTSLPLEQAAEPQCNYVVVTGESGRCIAPAVHDGLCAEHLAVVDTVDVGPAEPAGEVEAS